MAHEVIYTMQNLKKAHPGKVVIKDRIADMLFQQVLLRPEEYDVIAVDVFNPGDKIVSIGVRVDEDGAVNVFAQKDNGEVGRRAELADDSVDMVATDRLLVTGMHLHFPGFSRLLRDGDGYRLIPAAWEHAL